MSDENHNKAVGRRPNGTFADGVSGNPKGRPPRPVLAATPQALRNMRLAHLHQRVRITIDGKTWWVTKIEYVFLKRLNQAMTQGGAAARYIEDIYLKDAAENELDFTQGFRSTLNKFASLLRGDFSEEDFLRMKATFNEYRRKSIPQFTGAAITTSEEKRARRRPRKSPHD